MRGIRMLSEQGAGKNCMHSFVFKRLIYASRFSNQHASSHVFFTMTANSIRHLDICSYILHLLDKFIMSRRGEDGSGVGPQGSQSLTHCQDQPVQQTHRCQMQTPGIFNSQDSETVVLQSSANKISKSSKYLGDDMIPVLFLMFYLVSILTFGLKSTPALRRRNHLTVKPEKHCTISAVPDKRLALWNNWRFLNRAVCLEL